MTETVSLRKTILPCRIILAIYIAGAGHANVAWSQEESIPERGDRGIVVAPSDGQITDDQQAPDSSPRRKILPMLPPVMESEEALSAVTNIKVNQIFLEGNTVLPVREIAAVIAPYENRLISIGELHDLRNKLSLLYYNYGYVTSGVIIPDQKVTNGIVRLQAVEGRLVKVEFVGNDRLRDSYLLERIDLDMTVPLNSSDIQNSLRLLQSNPRIRQINAQLLPDINLGESILRVKITENQNYWFHAAADNYRSPSVDEMRASFSVGNNNLTGNGDVIEFNAGVTRGLNDYGAYYAYPLSSRDLILKTYYSRADSIVVEQPYDLIDITGETETWGLALSRPFRPNGLLLVASAGFEHKRGANTLLGIPFSFSPGEKDGKSTVSVVYLSSDWLWQKPRQALELLAGIRIGVDKLDATINEDAPDSKFVSFQGQVQLAQKMPWRSSQLVLRAATQLTHDPLLPLEKFPIGGNATVRGYRENTFVRDNGLAATAELRIPMYVDKDGIDIMNMDIVPFVDYGIAWDADRNSPTSNKESISSIGLAYRWAINKSLFFQVAYGHALKNVNIPADSLQDRGFQFQLAYALVED